MNIFKKTEEVAGKANSLTALEHSGSSYRLTQIRPSAPVYYILSRQALNRKDRCVLVGDCNAGLTNEDGTETISYQLLLRNLVNDDLYGVTREELPRFFTPAETGETDA